MNNKGFVKSNPDPFPYIKKEDVVVNKDAIQAKAESLTKKKLENDLKNGPLNLNSLKTQSNFPASFSLNDFNLDENITSKLDNFLKTQ